MRIVFLALAAVLVAGSPANAQVAVEDLLRIPPAFRSWIDPTGPLGVTSPGPSGLELRIAGAAAPLAPQRSWLRDWGPTLLLGATLGVLQFAVDLPANPRWSAKNSLDDSVRDAFVGGSRSTRDAAGTASTVLYGALGVGLLGDWVWLRDEYGGVESARREIPWILGSAVSNRAFKLVAGRERPYADDCAINPRYISGCEFGRDANSSFYSGHTTGSATIAGLLCARHLHRADRSGMDLAICGAAVSGSVATGLLRMTADQHWFTDTLAGWATGALFGYVLPVYFDFGRQEGGDMAAPGFYGVTPVVGTRIFGLRYEKRF